MVGIIFLLVPWLVVGCGISEEVYNAVVAERDATQAQVQSLQGDLTEAQAQIKSLQGDLAEAQTEVQAAKERMLQAKTNAEVVNALFVPALTGELDEMSEMEGLNLFLEWHDKTKSSEDQLLMTKFEALIDSGFGDEQMLDFFVYVLESIPEILE